ncbi:DUF1904 family protein [Brevibacillus sp. NRS-1366]|uniref:DUF1904 family protein n=1 Tax=Brevibacillus sp. NRS-1366 TaxID=3233899 RepID=UPI003D1C8776
MPFLRFKGFDKNKLTVMSPSIIEQFADIANVAPEKVKIELLHVEQITNSPYSVEILMFEREQRKHDDLASMLHETLKQHGFEQVHIFFILLSPTLYYKEGLPLQRNQVEMVR